MRRRKTVLTKDKKVGGVKIPFYLLGLGVIFLITTVFFTIEISTLGAKLNSLQREEARLVNENKRLKDTLVNTTSLTSVEDVAEDLGFGKPDTVLYISEEEAVAKLP